MHERLQAIPDDPHCLIETYIEANAPTDRPLFAES